MSEEKFFKALEARKLKNARRQLKILKGKVPRTRHLYLEGLLLECEGKLTEALKKFDMALVLHLSDHCIWFAKAKVLEELGKIDMAKRAVERAIRLSPGDPEVHLLYGKILYSMNRYPEARAEIERSLSIQSGSAEALTLNGILISILDQDYLKALSYYDDAIEIDPDISTAWTNRGIALRQIGDKDGALYSFQKALILDPRDSTASGMLIKMGAKNVLRSVITDGSINDDDDQVELEEMEDLEEAEDEDIIDDWDDDQVDDDIEVEEPGIEPVTPERSKRTQGRKEKKRNVAAVDRSPGKKEADSENIDLECPKCGRSFSIEVDGRTKFGCPGCGLKGIID